MVTYGRKRAYGASTTGSKLARSRYTPVKKTRSKYRFFAPLVAQTRTGFPGFMKMTHRYNTTFRLTSTAGGIKDYVFSANGMYDPDITSTGHQPMYFDQMGSIYDHYLVTNSRCKIQLIPVVASAGCQSIKAVLYQQDTATPAVPQTAIEKTRSNWTMISHVSNTFGPQNKLSLSWSAMQTFGNKSISDATYQGTVGANPVEQSYFILSMQDAVQVGIISVDVNVTLEYDAVWSELTNNGGS